MPLFPFWVVNLAAAMGGIRLVASVPATALGIIRQLRADRYWLRRRRHHGRGRTPDLSVLSAPMIVLPLIGLAVLALLPVLWRQRRGGYA